MLLAPAEALRLVTLDALADMEAGQLFALVGARSTTAWLAAQPSAGIAAPDVTLARRLAACSACARYAVNSAGAGAARRAGGAAP